MNGWKAEVRDMKLPLTTWKHHIILSPELSPFSRAGLLGPCWGAAVAVGGSLAT